MIFIAAKFRILDQHADDWPDLVADFTNKTRQEPGCLWFEWARSVDDPNQYVLLEAFRDESAGASHVVSQHFKEAIALMPGYLRETPRIINTTLVADDWALLGEVTVSPVG